MSKSGSAGAPATAVPDGPCDTLGFLERVGGGYMFIHRRLLEPFAEKPVVGGPEWILPLTPPAPSTHYSRVASATPGAPVSSTSAMPSVNGRERLMIGDPSMRLRSCPCEALARTASRSRRRVATYGASSADARGCVTGTRHRRRLAA